MSETLETNSSTSILCEEAEFAGQLQTFGEEVADCSRAVVFSIHDATVHEHSVLCTQIGLLETPPEERDRYIEELHPNLRLYALELLDQLKGMDLGTETELWRDRLIKHRHAAIKEALIYELIERSRIYEPVPMLNGGSV